jgi:hypothetical protein
LHIDCFQKRFKKENQMKLILIGLFMFVNPNSYAAGDNNAKKDCIVFWGAIEHANVQFESHKDKKAGKKLLELLPSEHKQAPSDCAKQSEAIDALEKYKSYRTKLLSLGDPLAYQISFRMMHIADGAFAEFLNADLAGTIHQSPEKFLKYLKAEKGDVYCPKDLVRATGDLNISTQSLAARLRIRVRALRKVKTADLQDLKLDCIKQLQAP